VNDRVRRAQATLRERRLEALLVGPSADLFWLTGYRALASERMTLLVVPAEGDPTLLVPELERARAEASGAGEAVAIESWGETEDPTTRVLAVARRSGCSTNGAYAVQDQLWSLFLVRLQDVLPHATWREGGLVTRVLRIRKAPEEIDALTLAAAAIDRVHEQLPEMLAPGRSEREVGRDVADAILEEHDEVSFVIVASGPNGASPHHETGERVLQEGDAVVVDIGGVRNGYCSDMTRNYVVGAASDGYRAVHDIVEEAQAAGVEAVRPGVTAESIDRACRAIISEAGYGDRFVHRTGHGIGVEGHEHPYLVEGNSEALEVGMAFSVEPGIYIPGRFGARIEDIVVVTEDGGRRLNKVPRGIVEVGAG
jgi:Xaa-Pro aminopeptidase